MFNMNVIGKTIRQARIQQNMTQLELADRMGVSFQAVSNWERGNSMPDISKLEPLCEVLNLNVQELLSGEPQTTAAVVKVLKLKDEPLTVDELADVAPLLPPDQMESETKKASAGKNWDLKKLSKIIPFLDEDLLEEICDKIQVVSLKELVGIAPFLDEDILDKMVMSSGANDWEGIVALAPFLGDSTLDTLAQRCLSGADIHSLKELAPFLSDKTLGKIAMSLEMDNQSILELAPFLDEETLDSIVQKQISRGETKELTGLAPFLSDDTLSKIALASNIGIKTVSNLAPFLDEKTLDKLVERQLKEGDTKGLSALYPFLSRDSMRKILRHILDSGNMDDAEDAAFFL